MIVLFLTKKKNMKSFKNIQLFTKMLWLRINQDRLTTSAAGLAYTTILALEIGRASCRERV